jgi:hypothetical protein
MRYTIASALAAWVAVAAAFKDTSPYLLLSTSKCALSSLEAGIRANRHLRFPSTSQEPSSRQIQASSDVIDANKNFLNACLSDTYIIVSQPTVHVDDLSNSRAVPHLREAMSDKKLRTKFGISEVVGEVNPEELKDYLVSNCQAAFIDLDGSSKLKTFTTHLP